MRTLLFPTVYCCWALSVSAQQPVATDSTGLPGDQFSLQGALEMFKKSIDLEQFETALNTEGNHVNNLDLNGDGQTDYVRVESQREGDAVAITLRAPVSKEESQDVAVIEIEKTGPESAVLQIRGDEELYGKDVIIEPFEEQTTEKSGKGPSAPELLGVQVVVNVWAWNPVPWCFSARYYPYASAWYWGHYPPWWRPWRPHPWRAWWGFGVHYRPWYRPWHSCRVVHAHALYMPRRVHSAAVRSRYRTVHESRPAQRPVRVAPPKPSRVAPTRPRRTTPPKPSRAPAGRPGRGGKR